MLIEEERREKDGGIDVFTSSSLISNRNELALWRGRARELG
jgi:hypothetical protein